MTAWEWTRAIITAVATLITLVWSLAVMRFHFVAWVMAGKSKRGVVPAHVAVVTLGFVLVAVSATVSMIYHPDDLLPFWLYFAGNILTWIALYEVGQYELSRVRARNMVREAESRIEY